MHKTTEKLPFGHKILFLKTNPLEVDNPVIQEINDDDSQRKNDIIIRSEPIILKNNDQISTKHRNLSRISSMFKSDLIRDYYLEKNSSLSKIKLLFKHFFLPNIIVNILGLIFIITEKFYVKMCYNPPICVCITIEQKIITIAQQFLVRYILWMLPCILDERFNIYIKVLNCVLASLLVFIYYLFSDEHNFQIYPIFCYLIIVVFVLNFIHSPKKSFKERISTVYKMTGFYVVSFVNFFAVSFARDIKIFLGDITFYIFYNLWVFLFLELTMKSLINCGKFLCEKNKVLIKSSKTLFYLNSRLALSYLMGFLAEPFLNFSIENFKNYGLILTYVNSLITLYTRVNFISIFSKKIFNYFLNKFRKKKEILEISNYDSTELYLYKKISGSTLDIIFNVSVSFMFFHFWKTDIGTGDCYSFLFDNSTFFGTLFFILINIIITISLFIYVLKRKNNVFSYPVWKNQYLNILILLGVHNLIEQHLMDYSGQNVNN